jgi:hypothetical protein
MKCYACGSEYIEKTGSLELPSKILGYFNIDNISYFKCEQCEEIMLPDSAWQIADREENRQINEFLSELPIKQFVGASKVAAILGMTRQAIHKHQRIRRGFIYSIIHEGKILYHNESVALFKDSGDGRFPLKKQIQKTEKEYVFITIPYSSKRTSFHDFGGIDRNLGWSKSQNTLPTIIGHTYGKKNRERQKNS